MAKKKIDKWQRDIAAAQAISGSTQTEVDRETWWDMLRNVESGDYEGLKKVINTKCPSAYPDTDASKTDED